MTKKFKTISSSKLAVEAAEIMKKYKIYSLVVEENRKIVGVIAMHDILEANVL